ncbi:MAG: hypothetical protein C4523_09535 [Myxococcales bacterium]|nr:MAG: hypothetical protein C4523_09535 [Myxococcales bacterium]
MGERKRVLVTIKTYPQPSRSHQELVCTAGVLDDGSFIRLYPVNFRYRPYWQWYKKYEWIEAEVEKNQDDPRRESYRPNLETIHPTGEWIDTKKNWAKRKPYVLPLVSRSMEELRERQEAENVSLGIIKPKEISALIVEPDEPDWKPKHQELFRQLKLFGPEQKTLEKIPFKFSYKFTCDDPRCNGHQMMIEDWELGQLYLSMRDKHGGPEIAAEKVRQKFYDQMCAADRDTYFFVGTVARYGTWIVLGVFWPKR